MKIQIILEVDADELDWGNSSVHPVDVETWGSLYDYDLVTVKYQGQKIEFVDTDKACEWLEFLYLESDRKDYAHA